MVETLRFDSAPGLPRLFADAVVNGRYTGSSLPEIVAERRGVRVEPNAVADYAHLCGFGLGAHPPMTWPHLLGFPLDYGESLDVTVHAADLRPNRRGRLVDLVAEVSSGGAAVWRGVSTYLARGGGGDDQAETASPPDVSDLAGRAVVQLRFGEDAGRRYASVSGDVNPIHMHALSARALGFDRAIAHGMFSYARVLASLGALVPEAGSSTVWFRKPVKLPSTTRLATSGPRPHGRR